LHSASMLAGPFYRGGRMSVTGHFHFLHPKK